MAPSQITVSALWVSTPFKTDLRSLVEHRSVPGARFPHSCRRRYGPKPDGTYVVEFKIADGEALAISVPASETRVLRHFQERMPYGLFVPDGP